MKKDKISIGIIGSGMMGQGIVYSCLQKGFEVFLVTKNENDFRFINYLEKKVLQGKITEEQKENYLHQLSITINIEELRHCDIIIETITEDLTQKIKLLSKVDSICSENTLIVSNTSTISISKLQGNCPNHYGKVAGLHFMSPVPQMELVEIIKTLETTEVTLVKLQEFVKSLDKTPLIIKDSPGFISSRLLAVYINEAVKILSEGVADAETIDKIAMLGLNHPIGPLKLADEIGLDTSLRILDSLYSNYKESKFNAHVLLRQLVDLGILGKKTGQGFYKYSK